MFLDYCDIFLVVEEKVFNLSLDKEITILKDKKKISEPFRGETISKEFISDFLFDNKTLKKRHKEFNFIQKKKFASLLNLVRR